MNNTCHRCRKEGTPPGKAFHAECWEPIKAGIESLPPIYRQLRPIKPVQFVAGKPFATILGECGFGKSVSAGELVERHAIKAGLVPQWMNAAKLLKRLTATFNQESTASEDKIIHQIGRAELLCIDDIGAEKISEYSVSVLYLILNERGEFQRPTIITTNLSLDDIAAKLDDRIANRLARYSNIVALTKCNVALAGDGDHRP